MNLLSKKLKSLHCGALILLDSARLQSVYCPINLSIANTDLNNYNIQNPTQCQTYITTILKKYKADIAFGGYLEKRNIYGNKENFSSEGITRNIHLGLDFWTKAGTEVLAPLDGTIHSFQNNKIIGDYGPTIILEHEYADFTFHTLYGHLSLESLKGLYVGKFFKKGDILAKLGTTDINVNYAPHLHFQIIEDMQGNNGDYPGVCDIESLAFYAKNCPDPMLLLQSEGSFSR